MFGFIAATEGDLDIEYEVSSPLVSAYVYDTKWRVGARGNAKQHESDPWNLEFGMKLAYLRAVERLSSKTKRKMLRSL